MASKRAGSDRADDVGAGAAGPASSAELETLFAELPDGAAALVLLRQNDEFPTRWDYLKRIPVSQFSLEAVKAEFGGGCYRGRVIDATGKFIPQDRIEFSIDSRFLPAARFAGGVTPTIPAAPSPSAEIAELRDLISNVVKSLVAASVHRPAAAPVPELAARDPYDIALRFAEILTKSQAVTVPAAALPTDQLFAVFQKGIELGSGMGAPAAGSDLVPVLQAAAPLFAAIAEKLRAEAGRPPRLPSPIPASGNGAPMNRLPSQVHPAGSAPAWLDRVRPYLPQVLAFAREGRDPVETAALVLHELPGSVYDELEEAAAAPDFVESTQARIGPWGVYDGWLRRLLDAIRAEVLEDAGEDGPAAEGGAPAGADERGSTEGV